MGLRLSLFTGLGILSFGTVLLRAGDPDLPAAGWPATRYEILWTNSPFSVATPEAIQESSVYSLQGVAQFDGISYANLTEKKSGEHFVLSSNNPVRGLMLMSISRGKDLSSTQAVVLKEGLTLTLKLESVPSQSSESMTPAPNPAIAQGNPPLLTPDSPEGMPINVRNMQAHGGVHPVAMRRASVMRLPPQTH